uniref:non-specific serine/threonine protein kinase n=1 Tax=Aegilops tauschii TaxID=37682 RepID=M8CF42_AEGTA
MARRAQIAGGCGGCRRGGVAFSGISNRAAVRVPQPRRDGCRLVQDGSIIDLSNDEEEWGMGDGGALSPIALFKGYPRKMVMKVALNDSSQQRKALKALSNLHGIDAIAADLPGGRITVTGVVDPVDVVGKLRRLFGNAEIVSVWRTNDSGKKKADTSSSSSSSFSSSSYRSRGVQDNGLRIAVKKLHLMPGLDDEEFIIEFHNLHKFLLSTMEKIFQLEWKKDIYALNTCKEEALTSIFLILLDNDMMPKIGGFGFSRFFDTTETFNTSEVARTSVYMPPEYVSKRQITPKFDVFSLGIIILQIMAGKESYTKYADIPPKEFIEHVYGFWVNRMQGTISKHTSREVRTCIEIALKCVESSQVKRPTINQIIQRLNKIDIIEFSSIDELYRTREFAFEFLERITNDFSDLNKVGSGGYGDVYKGVLDNGEEIAVKKLHQLGIDDEQFKNEGGSLNDQLSAQSCKLDWNKCYKIIRGICEGLHYLHNAVPPIYHLDLKPGNILLDKDMVAKIGDFGLSRLFDSAQTYMTASRDLKGTIGYMPPEYIEGQKISPKFDVFSLGVIIIKMMAGKEASYAHTCREEFIEHVCKKWQVRLQATMRSHLFEEVRTCIEIALKCVEDDRIRRPTIAQIVNELSNIGIAKSSPVGQVQATISPHVSEEVRTCIEIVLKCVEDDRTRRPTIAQIINELSKIGIAKGSPISQHALLFVIRQQITLEVDKNYPPMPPRANKLSGSGYHAVAKRAEAERAEVERKTEAEEEHKTEAEEERELKMKGAAEIEAEPCNTSSEVVTPPEAGEQEGGSRESARLHAPSKRYAGNDWVRHPQKRTAEIIFFCTSGVGDSHVSLSGQSKDMANFRTVKLAYTTLIAERSTYNASMAKTENSRSGINELYPPVGHAEAAALVAAAASSAAFLFADVEEVDDRKNQKGVVSETCSPVDRVRGGRDGVTGGSSSKGTTSRANVPVVDVPTIFCDLCCRQRVMGDVVGNNGGAAPAMANPIPSLYTQSLDEPCCLRGVCLIVLPSCPPEK